MSTAKKPAAPKKCACAKKAATEKKAVKAAPAKKPAAPKKCACAKKPVAEKKAAPAKKPVAEKKTAPAKKAVVEKKTAPAKKAVVESPIALEETAKVEKGAANRKPITVVKKPTKPAAKKPDAPTLFENNSQDIAFAFAERMKRLQREEDERRNAASGIKLPHRPTTRAKGSDSQQFAESDLAEFRKRLILLRQEALGQSSTLRDVALEQTDERGGEEEDGSDAFLRLQNLSQVASQMKIIQMIDEALTRIDEGTYGICENCGKLIRKPRLMNLPFVHTCMECQMQMESGTR